MEFLTNEEKIAVLRFIEQKPGISRAILESSIYIIPSLALAVYGLFKLDFLAVTVAYSVLFGTAIFYLIYSENYSKHLRSALRKYESMNDSK